MEVKVVRWEEEKGGEMDEGQEEGEGERVGERWR